MSSVCRLSVALMLCLGAPLRAADAALAGRANEVLSRHCHACHGQGGSSKGGLGAILDRDLLVNRALIVPGKPAESELFRKVQGGEMPPGKKPKPSEAEISTLREWIAAGAPALPAPPRSFVGPAEVARLIRADIDSFPARQRRFLRYVTFTHLHNANWPAADLALAGPGLSKLLNSLSWHPRISRPTPIDPARTVYRVDLRDYRWTARSWDRLIAVYPYRLTLSDASDRACAEATGCDGYQLRGDWLLATASRGKLYYDLLDMPSSDKGVERILQVDVARDIQEETAVRSGFNGSGVSRNNRVIERHDAAYGALWRSYDFGDNVNRQNIFENPLGPAAGQHSFRPAGGEVIFHLPAGMQGYLLVNGDGRRIEKAPVEIVSDPLRPDKQVEAGLSCMTCHGKGLIHKDDQVRAHVDKNAAAFPAAVVENVRGLYPLARRFRVLLEGDNKRYLAALEAAGVSTEGPEPVSTLTLRYEAAVDLAGVSAEFGVKPEEFSRRLAASASLQRLIGALQARGGTVQRQLLEEQFSRIAGLLDLSTVTAVKVDQGPKPEVASAFEGHTDAVHCLALSADGKFAMSGGRDDTLRLWDVATGRLLRTFEGHDAAINGVAIAPDGKRVLSASDDRTVRLWDVASGKELARLKGHLDRVRAVAFAPDGKHALSAGQDRVLRLWDLDKVAEVHALSGHAGAVLCVCFSPNGRWAVSGGADGTLRLWDVKTGREKEQADAHRRGVLCVAFSPDGKSVLSGGEDRAVRLWSLEGLRPIRSMTGHVNAPIAVGFAPEGKLFSASGQTNREDHFLRLWDGSRGEELAGRGGEASVWCAAFAPDGSFALTAGSDKRIRRWSMPAPGK